MTPRVRKPCITLGTGGAALGLLSALIALLLALPAGGQTREHAAAETFPPALTVGVFGGNFATGGHTLDLTVDLISQTSRPGRISLYVPDHFQIQPNRDPGSPVGKAFLFV